MEDIRLLKFKEEVGGDIKMWTKTKKQTKFQQQQNVANENSNKKQNLNM